PPAAGMRPRRCSTRTPNRSWPGWPTRTEPIAMPRLNAHELVDLVLDEGSFLSWDTAPIQPASGVSDSYSSELTAAAEKSGVDEAVITGEGTIAGRRVAVVVGEFRFLAGSIGVAAAERLVDAIERATLEGLPLLAGPASGGTRRQEGTSAGRRAAGVAGECRSLAGPVGVAAAEGPAVAIERATLEGLRLRAGPASGGTRMQEGTIAFLSMVKITNAVAAHTRAGLAYL